MEPETQKIFQNALETAKIITELMDETVRFETDANLGTISFEGNTVHISDSGVHRVTAGIGLVFSGTDVQEAIIEAVTAAIASRTREFLRDTLKTES